MATRIFKNYNPRDPDWDGNMDEFYERAFDNFLEEYGYEPNEEEWEAEFNKLMQCAQLCGRLYEEEEEYYYE
jgi:beta-phosphoglucomutase-like phosphatase (HAD superfamily)